MNRLFKPFLLIATTVVICNAAFAQQWQLPTLYSTAMFQTQNVEQFTRDLAQMTGNKLRIQVHAGGSLFKGNEIRPAVESGKAQIGEVIMSSLSSDMPLMGIDSIPFLTSSYQDARLLWRVSRNKLEQDMAKRGLQLLFSVPWPPQGLYSKKPIQRTSDFRGLKFRTFNPATRRMAELLGATPIEVAVVDLPKAFEEGKIDAFFSSAATGVDIQAWKYLGYYYEVRSFIPKNVVFVNRAEFLKLDKATQQSLLDAAANAEKRGWELSEAKAREFSAELAKKGIKVLNPDPGLLTGLDRIGETLVREWLREAKNVEGLPVVLDYLAQRFNRVQ